MADPSSSTGVDAPPDVHVVVSDEQDAVTVDADRYGALASAVLRSERTRGELTLTFVERGEIAALNREHLGGEGPTDVLAFPLDAAEGDDGPSGTPDEPPVLLGDVVVCPAVAAENAPRHAGSLDDELALLTVHGVLHVLGHDHDGPTETAAMRRLEHELLTRHHWRGPAPAGFRQEPEIGP